MSQEQNSMGSDPATDIAPLAFLPGQRGFLVCIDKNEKKAGMMDELISFFEKFPFEEVVPSDLNDVPETGDQLENSMDELDNSDLGNGLEEGNLDESEATPSESLNGSLDNGKGGSGGSSPRKGTPKKGSAKSKRGSKQKSESQQLLPKPEGTPAANNNSNSPSTDGKKKMGRQQEKRKLFYEMQRKTENMQKPQLKFATPVINDDEPFIPKLPLILKPVGDRKTKKISYEQPYKSTIRNWLPPPAFMSVPRNDWPVRDLQSTPYYFVSSTESLGRMMQDLRQVTEISFDVEHSDRSYLGLTCLIQISTRYKDYVVDCLSLRDHLHCLNEIFTHPEILKVAHSAQCDVSYIQRDFGVYLVGLFDTCEAEKVICSDKRSAGLAALLAKYLNVETDKKYQLADWRIRPLTRAMQDYARTDTHYLLKLYDLQKAALLQDNDYSNLASVYENSKDICVIRYDKPDHNDWMRKYNGDFNNRQTAALSQLNHWRNEVAKLEDDTIHFIASNKTLVSLSTALPSTWDEMITATKSGGYLTPFLDRSQKEILEMMKMARNLEIDVHLKYDTDDSNRTVVSQMLKPKAAHWIFLLAKTENPAEIVYKIMEKCHQLKVKTYPRFIKRILPIDVTCEKDLPSLVQTILNLLPTGAGTTPTKYGIVTNVNLKPYPNLHKCIRERLKSVKPTWGYVTVLDKADFIVAIHSVETLSGVSVFKNYSKYHGFFLQEAYFNASKQ